VAMSHRRRGCGSATFRARVLPRLAVVAVLVAMLLKMFASGVIPATLALGGVAFAGLGVTAIRAYRNRLSS